MQVHANSYLCTFICQFIVPEFDLAQRSRLPSSVLKNSTSSSEFLSSIPALPTLKPYSYSLSKFHYSALSAFCALYYLSGANPALRRSPGALALRWHSLALLQSSATLHSFGVPALNLLIRANVFYFFFWTPGSRPGSRRLLMPTETSARLSYHLQQLVRFVPLYPGTVSIQTKQIWLGFQWPRTNLNRISMAPHKFV